MYKNKKILAVVPARGGSKDIKNKNLKKIKGSSLIQITASILESIKYIDCSMISTDSLAIASEGKKFGLKFFQKRSKNLSDDRIGDAPVLREALLSTEKELKIKFDIILMTQVTSPLRTKKNIIDCIKLIIDKNLDAVWSVSKIDKKHHPLKQLKIYKKNLCFFNPGGSKIIARQQLGDTFIRNGAVYAFSRKTILNMNLMPKKSRALILKSKQVSIDSLKDLEMVKKILF